MSSGEGSGVVEQHSCDVECDVSVPDNYRAGPDEVDVVRRVVRLAVVPADEIGGAVHADQLFSRNGQAATVWCTNGVDNGVVVRHQLRVADLCPDFDVQVAGDPVADEHLLEDAHDRLSILMVRRDTVPDETEGCRKSLENVHFDVVDLAEFHCGIAGGGARAYDGYPQ